MTAGAVAIATFPTIANPALDVPVQLFWPTKGTAWRRREPLSSRFWMCSPSNCLLDHQSTGKELLHCKSEIVFWY